ncbi:hypothetical protein PENTCL1PPCAC_2495 [Pristionchus entomophagus]|uniref:F-box domain-containing protein n=1 Tax=Pristionchus entomophagus TaxID=358040 RepID=A0AAV5SD12_9BILA|nr:hypothetical protein PENTCL1PPCAC_2495 [Pristionchus entomophagus]
MPSNKLPTELWDHILSFCDHPSEWAISKVSQRLADIVTERNEFALEKCRRKGVTLPSNVILSLSFENPDLPLDATLLFAHNPFGCCISPSPSTVRGFEVEESDGKKIFSSKWTETGVMERGALEFTLDYESMGIPKWIMDGLRPRIVVSAVLQRRDGSSIGSRVAATIGLWRLDGMTRLGKFASKQETVHIAIWTVENGQSESRCEIQMEPSATLHGHPAFGGSDGLRIAINSGNCVRISDVQLRFELPDEIPSQFYDWLIESRKLRESRSLKGARNCIEVGLFGL